ncbi:unnamed protein product [Miscanthus lutarioriparius]|uniref:Uncharacterized protein n=1 Tax=Miscanthus lutarioriparius TaxID=422564 RepID=A0A811Q7N5_9POAL|nr:unnamed protein product [Miscanthus lutarioriparius]
MALLNKDAKALCFATLIVMAMVVCADFFLHATTYYCGGITDALGYKNPNPHCLYTQDWP